MGVISCKKLRDAGIPGRFQKNTSAEEPVGRNHFPAGASGA
jgi:hypothetical protein